MQSYVVRMVLRKTANSRLLTVSLRYEETINDHEVSLLSNVIGTLS